MSKTKAIRFWLNEVADLGCVICERPAIIHHLTRSPFRGFGMRAEDTFVIPLCPEHHNELHGGSDTWEMRYGAQVEHLGAVIERVMARLLTRMGK